MTRRVVFFGASEGARRTLSDWPGDLPRVSYVVDNDSSKWGSSFEGLSVRSPTALADEPLEGVFIVVASFWYDQIAAQLASMGFETGYDFARPDDAIHALRRETAHPPYDCTVALLEDNWFGLDYGHLRRLLSFAGIRTIRARVPVSGYACDVTFDRETYRSVRVNDVPLFAACLFDICLACRVTPDRLDAASSEHWKVIEAHLHCAAGLARVAARLLDSASPDAVIVPQGHTTAAAVYRYLSVLRGIRAIAIENSLNSTRLVWDDLAGIAVNKIPARNYYWRWTDLVDADVARAHVAGYLASIKHAKTVDHQSPESVWTGASEGRKTVLYLANVLTDSSVLFNSRVGSQIAAIKCVARWALTHRHMFVLKLHPRERPGSPTMHRYFPPATFSFEGLTLAALQEDRAFWELMDDPEHCLVDFDNRYDTYDLIRQSDACVTVCSQAGLEALLMGRETVVLGDAYYGGLGFTHDVQDAHRIEDVLERALDSNQRRVDADRIAKFFYIFEQLYSIEKSADGVAGLISRTLGRKRLPVLPVSA